MENLISNYREEINRLDGEMFGLLRQRFALVEKIGQAKKAQGLPVRQPGREAELIAAMAKRTGFAPEFVEALYQVLFKHSYKLEE